MTKAAKWSCSPAAESFPTAAASWDALNRSCGNHVLLDSKFVGQLLRHFSNTDVTLAVCEDSQYGGMALLQRTRTGFWEVFTPSQAPLGPILVRNKDPRGETLRSLMSSLPGFPIQLAVLYQDPDFSVWLPAGENSPLQPVEFMQTGRVRLAGTFDEYWRERSSNLRHNLSRQRRRLQEQGRRLEFVAHRESAAMAACIQEYAQLESAGWKSELGTAIGQDNAQGRFYRDVFEQFAASGEAVVYQLLLDGKVVATDLCLYRDGMLVVLKTTYDETLKPLSAALLMREDIMRALYAEGGCRVVEFYGRALDWHAKWTNDFRPMYHINCHRNSVVSGIRSLVQSIR